MLWIGALVALVGNPIFGALSDRSTSRFGRRRPYLLGGVACGLAALGLIAAADSVPLVLLGWCAAQLAYNATLAALVAILPDRIPQRQRGTVVGILGVCMPIGQIAGTYLVERLAERLAAALFLPGVIGLVGVTLLVWILPDEPRPASAHGTGSPPRAQLPRHRNFSLAWLSRLLFVTGSVCLQAYQPFLLLDALGRPAADLPRLVFRSTLVQTVTVVCCSVLAGRVSDRLGQRKSAAMLGAVVQGAGLWLIAVARSYPAFLWGVAVMSIGHGIYEGVNLALVTEVLPDRDRHAAKDLGLFNIANTLPQVIAPLAAPAILAASEGYTSLFLIAGAIPMLGAVLLVPLNRVR